MAKNLYPVIDYMTCVECGECIKKCTNGVYDKEKAPIPKVISTENCVSGCHGCGNLCPTGSITYVGENTDWTPPNGVKTEQTCDCGGSCESQSSVCDCGGNC